MPGFSDALGSQRVKGHCGVAGFFGFRDNVSPISEIARLQKRFADGGGPMSADDRAAPMMS
jgi:hypothetical protein